MGLIPTLLIILVAAFIAGALAHRLRQPVILGFVLAGIALGPSTGGFTVAELIDVRQLSEVGVALLLFALGVEFSLATLQTAAPRVLYAAVSQLLLTLLWGFLVGQLVEGQPGGPIWFAAVIALSSPIIALQALSHLQLEGTVTARLARSLIIVENLAIVPFLFVLRQLQAGNTDVQTIAIALVEGVALLAILLLLGTRILPGLFAAIGRQEAGELPIVVVLASAAAVIYGTYLYGLTFVEVAFVAGLLLSQSELGSRALQALLSMRDLFGVLFFVSAGMLLDLAFLGAHIGLVAGLVLLVALGKMLILGGVMRLSGFERHEAVTVAVTLFPLSELSFVLASLALGSGMINDDFYSLIIAVGLITMLLTPFVARLGLRRYPHPAARPFA
jgi:CPA2 family monovalent cation:H+ antiporter-2